VTRDAPRSDDTGAGDGTGGASLLAPAHVSAPSPGAGDGTGGASLLAPAHVSAPSPGASVPAMVITSQAAGQAAGENFPVALRMLPRRYRQHLAAVYGFARSADDMGDKAPLADRLGLLDELEADLARLYRPGPGADGPRLAVVAALAPAVAQCAIPEQPFLDLIQANRQDQAVTRYQSFTGLVGYCRLSANPVGRIVLHVFGVATPQRGELSDLVCTALQLAEHWQDVAEDLRAGRIYLPAEDMDRFGVTEADLAASSAAAGVRELIAFETSRARGLLDQGAPIVGTLRGAARAAVAGYVAGGRAALAAITASGHDVLAATPRPGKRRVAAELVKAYVSGR
jgi:squalene synthase HpnC